MMLLFSDLLGGEDTPETICEKTDSLSFDALDEADLAYIRETVDGVQANLVRIDELIEAHAVDWAIGRIARVDICILRVAIYEMLCRDDVPSAAAINEAVELAKRYGGEKSYAFINGVLGSVERKLHAS